VEEEQMPTRFYAHSLPGKPSSEWQPLEEHLRNVAELANCFADPFGAGDLAHLAGLWHDLGKYQPEYQDRLRGEQIGVEHSGAGAAHAFVKNKVLGLPLAFVVAGHHSGLANLMSASPGGLSSIMDRVKSNQRILERMLPLVPESLVSACYPSLPQFFTMTPGVSEKEKKINLRRCEFWIRFLFSSLVDADRLDTENFMDNERSRFRGGYESIEILRQKLDGFLENKTAHLSPEIRITPVNQIRSRVLASCRQAAKNDPGVFTLTVPTGGGKTLSAMAFALDHAERHGLRRVVVVIPYTSIIEQNAEEYRLALGTKSSSNTIPTWTSRSTRNSTVMKKPGGWNLPAKTGTPR
jgi:CRISPR-associated endonuclease/helicase Cas3